MKEIRKEVEGLWGPPHGCIDPEDKSEEEAVIRETKEGVGLDVKPLKKLATFKADVKTKTIAFWLVEVTDNLEIMMDDHKATEYGWFTVDEILKLTLFPATRQFFTDVLDNKIEL